MLTKKLISGVLPVATIGGLAVASAANAASIAGGPILPNSADQFSISGIGTLDVTPQDGPAAGFDFAGSFFDFQPSADSVAAPGTGTIDLTENSGTGVFEPFTPSPKDQTPGGIIRDVGILIGGTVNLPTGTPVDNYLTVFDPDAPDGTPGFYFDLKEVVTSSPVFVEFDNGLGGTNTNVTVVFAGTYQEPDGTDLFDGSAIFTAQYVNQTEASIFAALEAGNPLDSVSYSATFSASTVDIPESDAKVGLAVFLGLGLLSIKKKGNRFPG